MKLEFENCDVTIDDSCEEAKKIKQGFDYKRNKDGQIVIFETRIRPNLEVIIPKLKQGQATLEEIQKVLAFLLDRVLK
jgi:hypothetical protein